MVGVKIAGICFGVLGLGWAIGPLVQSLANAGPVAAIVDAHATPPVLDTAADDSLRVMSLNVAHSRGLAFHQALLASDAIRGNLDGIAGVIEAARPDVVGLQEFDGVSDWSGRFDHASTLSTAAGLQQFFRGSHGKGWGPVHLDYGTGLLSRETMRHETSQRFETSFRDNKGFVVATIEPKVFDHIAVDVVSVHLDFASGSARARQLRMLEKALATREGPFVVMGDFNCEWGAADCVRDFAQRTGLSTDQATLDVPTFPADGPRHRLDWILVSPQLEIRSLWILNVQVSDHMPVVADIALRVPPSPAALDFHLQPGSDGINHGVDVGIPKDYDGTSIPQGDAPDIGAYEQ
ncbi:MAG: hypothetical protein A2289_02645 [Deltaproteobacteria bacterium RIFOXYA12_FULL_58_15]|nr:MAG: hypothetical protein A2289_02645 [Deltaproteobacteria bacterium RIFOXYA12_FULL_58_15]